MISCPPGLLHSAEDRTRAAHRPRRVGGTYPGGDMDEMPVWYNHFIFFNKFFSYCKVVENLKFFFAVMPSAINEWDAS